MSQNVTEKWQWILPANRTPKKDGGIRNKKGWADCKPRKATRCYFFTENFQVRFDF